jgi:hypothetical protein
MGEQNSRPAYCQRSGIAAPQNWWYRLVNSIPFKGLQVSVDTAR